MRLSPTSSDRTRRALPTWSWGLIAVVALTGAASAWRSTFPQLELFLDIRSKVIENYVEKVDESYMDEGAIRGLVVQTDPYNTFLRAKDTVPYTPPTEFDGQAGFEFGHSDETIMVSWVAPGSPAAKAGLAPGDRIIELQGTNVFEKRYSVYEANQFNYGKIGEKLKLQIYRDAEDVVEDLEFAYAKADTAKDFQVRTLSDGVWQLKFTRVTAESVKALATQLADLPGKKPSRVILDLRNCSGGEIRDGVALADLFLDEGVPLGFTRSYQERAIDTYTSGDGANHGGLPLTVFVNWGTTDAAEVAAALLQKIGGHKLHGEQTFGKVTLFQEVPFDESGRRLLILHATFYLPESKEPIHGKGLTPEVEILGSLPKLVAAGEEGKAAVGGESGLISVLSSSEPEAYLAGDDQLRNLLAFLKDGTKPELPSRKRGKPQLDPEEN